MMHFLLALLSIFHITAFAQEFDQFDTYRLPNNTKPESYDLNIRTWIHQANTTFTGSVRIGIRAVESTNFIRLHHNVQRLERVTVLSDDQSPISIGNYSYNRTMEFLTIPIVGSNLTEATRYFIEIDYVGSMNSYSGFYQSFYNVNGRQVSFGSTQFEATYARSAFPCFDELALKSNFTIRITHDPSYSAISNMPAISDTLNPDGSVTTVFETTPLMSTYLVAFHVSDFYYVTSSPPKRIPQRMFSRPTAINATHLALEAGELLIEALSEYIGIEYSLPKMDHVAIPNFPSSTSKENWGLLTSYESYTLFDESVDDFTRSMQSVQTISHDLAHSWFGNFVTPRWWTYLWIKEGFATFFEYFGIDLVYSDWNMMDFFVVDITQSMIFADSNEFTQPMTRYVEHPTLIDFHFNRVAYSKAGAILRMFWYMFGENTFMRGVKRFLEDNAYSDVAEEQLFDALDTSIRLEADTIIPPDVNVATIMSTWTRQAGVPLITVNRNYDDSTTHVTLRQERYYSSPPRYRENSTWWVPYNLATPRNPGFGNTLVDGWIPQNNFSWEITVDSLEADDYLLINKRAAGYYRVMYDERNFRLISDAILQNSSYFHSTNIAQLIDDSFEFYRNDLLPITTVLDLLRVLEFQSDFISWSPAFYPISHINDNLQGHQIYPIWTDFIRSLTEQIYDIVRVEDVQDEPILRKHARESIIDLACRMGSVHCRSDANRQLRRHIETGEDFHQNVVHVLMCASLRSATRSDFHYMWNRFMSLPGYDVNRRAQIIDWLGCSTSRLLLTEFIRSSIDSTNDNNVGYSVPEKYYVMDSIIRNAGYIGLDVALNFFIENAVEAYDTYGGTFVLTLSHIVRSAEHIERYLRFQNMLLEAGLLSQQEIDNHMTIVAESVKWMDTKGEVVNAWLTENFV